MRLNILNLKLAAVLAIVLPGMELWATPNDSSDTGREEVVRPVQSMFLFGGGTSHLTDTYLTPLDYSGSQLTLGYQRRQAMKFSPDNWVMKLDFNVEYDQTHNRAGNSTMRYGGIYASWNMMRRFIIGRSGFSAGVGPQAALDAGCLVNSRNGNNPASAKVSLTVDASAYAAFNFRLAGHCVTLRDDVSLPVTGAFFSPDYGELYYEIWLGNHSGLAHCAWWGNFFKIDNSLSADITFGSTTLRIGYRFGYSTTNVNHLVSRRIEHAFVFGVGGTWISLNPSKKHSSNVRYITPDY